MSHSRLPLLAAVAALIYSLKHLIQFLFDNKDFLVSGYQCQINDHEIIFDKENLDKPLEIPNTKYRSL